MKRSADWAHQWIFYLAAGFLFGAVLLRTLLVYGVGYNGRNDLLLRAVLGLLAVWLALFASEGAISPKWPRYFPIYLVLQTGLVAVLLAQSDRSDYFAVLLAMLGMQAMQRLNPRLGALWIGLIAPLMALLMLRSYGAFPAIALAVIYTALNVFVASYALTTRRAQAVRARNQALVLELQEANRQLQAYSKQLEQLAVTRERHRLARELHDSVTQTIFSMTLTTQSALLLLASRRDPSQVGAQIDRLNQLAASALAEMRVLISELRPEKVAEGGLVAALRRHLADHRVSESLAVSLEVEGDQPLSPTEEQGLFRIAQEALNNIVKHAQATEACIRVHLTEPLWMEIQDQGQGFDLERARDSGHVGLSSMGERAAEIGWDLRIITTPGAGTCVRVEKTSEARRT
jgi:signal transduction histidine kinase